MRRKGRKTNWRKENERLKVNEQQRGARGWRSRTAGGRRTDGSSSRAEDEEEEAAQRCVQINEAIVREEKLPVCFLSHCADCLSLRVPTVVSLQ